MEARRNRVEWSMWVSQCHQRCIISLQCVYHIDHIVPSAYSSRPSPMEVSFQAASNFPHCIEGTHQRRGVWPLGCKLWDIASNFSISQKHKRNRNPLVTHLNCQPVNVSLMEAQEGPLGQDHWIQTWLLRQAGIPTFWTFPTHSQGTALPW